MPSSFDHIPREVREQIEAFVLSLRGRAPKSGFPTAWKSYLLRQWTQAERGRRGKKIDRKQWSRIAQDVFANEGVLLAARKKANEGTRGPLKKMLAAKRRTSIRTIEEVAKATAAWLRDGGPSDEARSAAIATGLRGHLMKQLKLLDREEQTAEGAKRSK